MWDSSAGGARAASSALTLGKEGLVTIGLGDTPNGPSAAYAKLHARSFGKEGDQADNYYFIN